MNDLYVSSLGPSKSPAISCQENLSYRGTLVSSLIIIGIPFINGITDAVRHLGFGFRRSNGEFKTFCKFRLRAILHE